MTCGALKDLPFVAYGSRLPPQPYAETLRMMYLDLLKTGYKDIASNDEDLVNDTDEDGSLRMSYNLVMTTQAMVMCARKAEGIVLKGDDGSEVGYVALNGTMLGGTLMVKTEDLFEELKKDPRRLEEVLEGVGVLPTGIGAQRSL